MRVGIVGAGLSGLACARHLADAGHDPVIFEKARGVGGRTATRRADPLRFDHGAQYFTVRDPRMRSQLSRWRRDGVVALWEGRIAERDAAGLSPKERGPERWVGQSGMNAMTIDLAQGLDVRANRRVARVEVAPAPSLAFEDGASLGFDAIVVSAPPSQARDLLGPAAPPPTEQVTMQPCYAAMLAFDAALPCPYDGVFVNTGPLSWVARDRSKPNRGARETWVVHAGPPWSSAHLERGPEAVLPELRDALFDALMVEPVAPVHAVAHRWRFAVPINALEVGCIWDEERRIGLCGDWLNGARIEGAYLSGLALAEAISA